MTAPALQVFTAADGWLDLEADYLPRVVTRENGFAAQPALEAQAVAARTYLLRAQRDDPRLGTPRKPLANSELFQTYSKTATARALTATATTRGITARHLGELVICNYVAGALWTDDGRPNGPDATGTEKWVTYNEGRTGAEVHPSQISSKRADNRGCMSQNGADWLARHGHDYPAILRYFYGADLELDATTPASVIHTDLDSPPWLAPSTTAAASAAPLVALALIVASRG